MRKFFRRMKLPGFIAATAVVLPLAGTVNTVQAEEWEENTPYYEDDAWYDVSEWLDGNDYNPTDEVIGSWDNEVYDADVPNDDQDNDIYAWGGLAYDDYGYAEGNDGDWFYDYYDDSYASYAPATAGTYETVTSFYDFDDDGLYDSYLLRADTDADGLYDEFDYYALNETSQSNEAKSEKQDAESSEQKQLSKEFQFAGTVERTKTAKVRDAKRSVAWVNTDDGKQLIVDMGTPQMSEEKLQGKHVEVSGPIVSVGDKYVLLAQQAKIGDNESQKISRDGREMTVTVKNTRTVDVRDAKRTLAVVTLQDKDKQLLVDLGPADGKIADLKEGDELKITGVPVKAKDRNLVVAQKVSIDGESMKIDREQLAKQDEQSNQTAQR